MEIREIKSSDEKGIRVLFHLCFGKELESSYWEWKYRKSFLGSSAVVAIDNGEIIAHYGGIKMRFYFSGKSFIAYQPCDVMTHPKYRARIFSKRGAMVRAGEYFYKINQMDFAFGFPSERHAILGKKQLGYTEYGYVQVLSKRVLDSYLWNPSLKTDIGWDSVHEEELDFLWDEVKDNFGLSIEKKSLYIFWRYRDNPSKKYFPLIVRNRFNGKLIAFSALSFKEDELFILDFLFSRDLNICTLMKHIERFAKKNGMKKITLWASPSDPTFKYLMDYGFTQDKGIPYIFKILSNSLDEQFLLNHYYYKMGDYDSS